MASPFDHPPQSVCILRLSAIGDTCHVLPVVRTLQRAWPDTRFTWVIGRLEAKLLGHIPDIEFIVVDKGSTLKAIRSLRKAMQGRRNRYAVHPDRPMGHPLVADQPVRRLLDLSPPVRPTRH